RGGDHRGPHQPLADPGRRLVRHPHPPGVPPVRSMRAAGSRAHRWLAAGLVVLAVAIVGLERVSETSFTWHMIQHTLLIVVAAPLLALGAPTVLDRRPARLRRLTASMRGPAWPAW